MTIDLKQIRKGLQKHRGLQAKICRDLDISPSTFWKWKSGKFVSSRIQETAVAHLCQATAQQGDRRS